MQMFERRESNVPLLTKRVGSGNGILSFSRITSWHALLAGILFGVVLGMFLSMTLFSWLLSSNNTNADAGKTIPEMLPSIKDTEAIQYFEQRHGKELLAAGAISPKCLVGVDEVIEEQKESDEQETKETSLLKEGTVEDNSDMKNVVTEEPLSRLHEGTREISDFELTGGWRLTPDILKISEHFPRAKVMSESSPRLILFQKFITDEEIKHILDVASSHLSRSKVVGGKDGSENNVRTSYGAWLTESYRDNKIRAIEQRIHDAVGIPLAFGEGIYVLRYEETQKYNPHTDNCARAGEHIKDSCLGFLKRSGGPQCGEGHGGVSCGDRIATFIMYLKSPISGGETLFPKSKITLDNLKRAGRKSMNGEFADLCQNSLYFKLSPSPGDAVLFWDYIPRPEIENHSTFERSGSWEFSNATTEGMNDSGSLHGGCPVLDGEKWIATKWIRSAGFQ